MSKYTIQNDRFYVDNEVVPVTISDEGNVVRVDLDGTISSDMNWDKAKTLASEVVSSGREIFWNLDLGLSDPHFFLSDPFSFSMLERALKHFCTFFWNEFKEESFGICLYDGMVDYQRVFPWNADFKEDFLKEIGKEDFPLHDVLSNPLEKGKVQLYCLNRLIDYLHQLSTTLPEEIAVFALFDASHIENDAHLAFLLSQERFSHIHIGIEGSDLPIGFLLENTGKLISRSTEANLGLCLPRDEFWVEDEFEKILQKIDGEYRIIPEALLTEEWQGLDHLIVISKLVSPQGMRKLQGFCAAGGTVFYVGEKLGLALEADFLSNFVDV